MQYLQLMYTYAPAWGFGGPSRMLYDYARWMIDEGVTTHVIAGDVNHDYTKIPGRTALIDGIAITRVHVFWRSLVAKAFNCVSPAMLFIAMRRIAAFPGTTVVHVAEWRSPVFLYAAILRKLFSRKVVLVHSAFGMLHDKRSTIRWWWDLFFMAGMLRAIDVALAQNEHEAECYRQHFRRYGVAGGNVIVLPLHTRPRQARAEGERTLATSTRADLRRRYQVPEAALVCIFLGRLHYEKGILRAIDAFLQFSRATTRPAFFLIVGRNDGFQDEIQRHIDANGARDCIRIVNDVYEQRFDYYALSDMFLGFPTNFEETMLSAVEALSCGTPIVVSREADMPFVQEGGAGYVVDFSVEKAAECMATIAADLAGFRERADRVSQDHYMEDSARITFNSIIQNSASKRAQRMPAA